MSGTTRNPPVIRAPRGADLRAVAELLGELGYPTSSAAVQSRLAKLERDGALALLADIDDTPVGLATAYLVSVVHADRPVAVVSALVVRNGERRLGIGGCLMEAVETWARARQAYRITVASGLARDDAHAFYERIGYEHTAKRYSKQLEAAVT